MSPLIDLGRVAELPPRRRRRLERMARTVFAVCTVLTVFMLTLSAATIRLWWGRSATQVAISAALAVAAVLLCGVTAVNARRTIRAPRHADEPGAYGAVSVVRRERLTR